MRSTPPDLPYVHGYSGAEHSRLQAQGRALADLLHEGLHFRAGSRILEIGSGTGMQTLELLRRHPGVSITCVERDPASIEAARHRLAEAGIDAPVEFLQADVRSVCLPSASFDHLFACFVLEHIPDPVAVLQSLLPALKPGGTVTAIEGDHGTTCFHPDSPAARDAIECQVILQRGSGGDACVGRRLAPLLREAGVRHVHVEPLVVHVDGSRPELARSFTRDTFTAMVAGVRSAALAAGLSTPARFDRGIADLLRTTEADGVFVYTFFRARGPD